MFTPFELQAAFRVVEIVTKRAEAATPASSPSSSGT
jgi:hypothetical protein